MAAATITTGRMFDELPYEEGRRWELLEGELIEVSSPTLRHQEIVLLIAFSLRRQLGPKAVVVHDVEFALADSSRLRPDVCVLMGDRVRQLDVDCIPIPGAPDIAVEVISPSERASESQAKVAAYLRNGVTEVWQFYPKSQMAMIHRGNGSVTLASQDLITTPLLPGFTLTISEVLA